MQRGRVGRCLAKYTAEAAASSLPSSRDATGESACTHKDNVGQTLSSVSPVGLGNTYSFLRARLRESRLRCSIKRACSRFVH